MVGFYKNSLLSLFVKAFFIIGLFVILLFSFEDGWAQAPDISYQTPQIYTVNSSISPLTVNNKAGAVPPVIYGNVSTFAGNGLYSFTNGVGTAASFRGPGFLTFDTQGNLYAADPGNNVIRKIEPNATVTTFAGSGSQGKSNGAATTATFNYPVGVATDTQGNIFVADQNNNLIRKITPAGVVSTFAGNGTIGKTNGTGTVASFNSPFGMAFDSKGNLYLAAGGNNLIRKITPAGVVTTFAGSGSQGKTDGTGTGASFNNSTDVTVDSQDNIFVADHNNNLIRKITTAGVVTTFAGGGPDDSDNATTATVNLGNPYSMRIDKQGNMYVAAEFENQIKIISPNGSVRNLAGSGEPGYADGIGTSALLYAPIALVLDTHNNLFVSDNQNLRIRQIALTGYTIDKTLPVGLIFNYTNGTISGMPTVTSPATNYTITAYNGAGSSSTIVNITVNGVTPLAMQPFGAETTCNLSFNAIVSGGAGNYIYSSSNPAVAAIDATTGAITIMGAGVSTISVTDNTSEVEQVLTVAKANSNPTISITPDYFASCQGLSVTYTASVTNTYGEILNYQWQVNGQNAGTNNNQFTSSSLQTGDKITCTLQSNACFDQVTSNIVSLEADPMITPTVTITSSASGSIPDNTPVTFTAAVTNGGPAPNILWLLNGVSTGISGLTYASSCLNDGDVVTCTVNVQSGKCYTTLTANSNSIKVVITGPSSQSVNITASSTKILQGSPVTFNAVVNNAGGFMQYQWKINGVPAGTNSSEFVSSTLNNNDVITCTASNNSGCINTTSSGPITITVYTLIVFGPIPDKTSCDIDFAPGTSGGTPPYIYSSSNTNVAVSSGNYIHITGTGQTQINVTDQNGQLASQLLTVNEEATPIVTISADNTNICVGTPVNFTATISNPGSASFYQWEVNGNYTGTNSPQFTLSNLSSTDVVECIAFTPCSLSGFSNKISVNIDPSISPSVTIAQSPLGSLVAGTTITFTATAVDAGSSPTYQWQVNGNHEGLNGNQFISSSLNNGDIVTCVVTTDNVCAPAVTSNALTVTFLAPSNVIIPNAFTPNSDGINDFWEIGSLNSYYPKCEVSIYNRYGTLVFQSKGYSNAWDGTFHGSKLPSATYYYIIKLNNTSPALSGPVTIIR
jgi:gliding motility-associated-like protein